LGFACAGGATVTKSSTITDSMNFLIILTHSLYHRPDENRNQEKQAEK
jgi:hypothetical protein